MENENNALAGLKTQLNSLEYYLSSLEEKFKKYNSLTSHFLRAESINKIRRFGIRDYNKRFTTNPLGNVSAHMRTFSMIKLLETVTKSSISKTKKDISKVKFEIECSKDI